MDQKPKGNKVKQDDDLKMKTKWSKTGQEQKQNKLLNLWNAWTLK